MSVGSPRLVSLALLLMTLVLVVPANADDEVLKPQGSNKPGLKKVQTKEQDSPSNAPKAAPAPQPARQAPTDAAAAPELQAALAQWKAGNLVEARTQLNALLSAAKDSSQVGRLREYLTQLADETVFGPQIYGDDPLVEPYKVQAGEVLVKIARKFKVPAEMLAYIHGGGNLAARETIKIPRGPFRAVISKSEFRLDLYLKDTYVHSFPVGLGLEGGTPTGTWKVTDRQRKPTWTPPPTAKDRQVRGPNDPLNPLGGYWIKLEGVEGDAVGRTGFGIHGTIEPETVGKAASLGCIRMLPDDIAFVFRAMQPGASTVNVVP